MSPTDDSQHTTSHAVFSKDGNSLVTSQTYPSDLLGRTGFIRGLRFYIQGQNLLTFTNFSGLDPEGTRNIYAAQYPMSRQYTFGLDLLF